MRNVKSNALLREQNIQVPSRWMDKDDIVYSQTSPGLIQLCIAGINFGDDKGANSFQKNLVAESLISLG